MGCSPSHQLELIESKLKMNNNVVAYTESIIVPIQNPYVSLTQKDTFHLKASWKGIKRALEVTGIAMFIK